jgi:rare lipoprotein A
VNPAARAATLPAMLLLASCGGLPTLPAPTLPGGEDRAPRDPPGGLMNVPDAVPKIEARSKYGNPQSYTVNGITYRVMPDGRGYNERGIASFYGEKFHSRRTSNGESYDMYAMTAAHKTLPLPAYAEVENLRNGRVAVVRVNDRGPFHANRIIDLSYTAAVKLGIASTGTGLVEVRAIDPLTWGGPRTPQGAPASPPPPPEPAPGAPPAAEPRLFAQLGAFGSRANAGKLAQQARGRGFKSLSVSETHKDGATLWRVRAGPVAGVESSDRLVADLRRAGFKNVITVIDN